ncbi:fungal-specific transcription factor domain-containing protein [Suillus fuscotomentosus]|uniref:Fungal-specific transcription factor domain-containing protein n=1 Tax=Suillus fuscotomentosus TaxID=1912939 RepID=A0AAD4E821_9AGAM|nr:fungal-specific transcription factor domain-containing protein [Suillus fuscotomentosus]KAG1901082.1 fungal-specific transcription factor domain-containing protein [Suillus fuscotomentosus]
MGPIDRIAVSISKGKTGTSPTGTGSDFPQDSSSSNPEVAPGASSSIIAIPAVDEIVPSSEAKSTSKYKSRSPRSESKLSLPQTTMRRKITQPLPRARPRPNPANYISLPSSLPPPYSRSTSPHLPDSSRQLVGQAQALWASGSTGTSWYAASNASSATTLYPALPNSTPWPERSHLSPRLRDTSESGEEFEILDSYDGANTYYMEFTEMSPYTSSSASPSFVPAPNINWRLLSFHPARPNLLLHFDIAFPTYDIEYMQDSSYGIRQTPLSDADLDMPAADEELTNMTINFKCDPLQWDIYVKRDKGIRVRDVFEAIYSAFDIPLTLHEKSLIPIHLHAGCEEAFRLRCNLAPVLPILQKRQGWKRIDALLHETIFRGLAQSKRGECWTLNLSGTMSKAIDRRRLMSYHIATDSTVRYRARGLLWDPILELETTASHSPQTLPVSEVPCEYLPPYPNSNPNTLPNYSNNDLFNLPLSAAFVPRTGMGMGNDIVLACRICNFVRSSAILQHETLYTLKLLNPIPPLEPSSQDYTWAFFCRFAPLGALFDSPCRGPLPVVQLGSDRACLVERLEANFENPGNTMSWLHGPAGTGKSVIAYTLASRFRQKNRLAGSFFFSRRHANGKNARSLVFALAYQLGLSQPQAKEKIIKTLDSDPGIISPSRDLHEQFARLLIEPLEAIDWRSPSRVFVIDAIDQCQDQVPQLISLLTRLLSHMVDVGLHIFFTSRDYMKGVLIKRHLFPMISDIALDLTGITRDVRSFLCQSFDKIYKRHRLQCRKPWPPEEVLGRLVDRVGPHFITGSIIVKFVESLDHDPTERMDFIDHISFNPLSSSESSMDDFYKFIISTADDPGQAYLYLTIVANLAGMLSCSQLDDLLNRGPNPKFDMRSALSQLSPLVCTSDGHDGAVQICHESLCDFLSDPLRCGEQLISEAVVHRLLAYSSLSLMIQELPNDNALCSHLSQLAMESSSVSLRAFDNVEVLSSAIYSPPEPLPFLSMLWHIMQRQYTGFQVDPRTKSTLLYFCHTWQILQHLDLSTANILPAFRFLANIKSLPVLLAFPIFLAFESPRSDQTLGPSTLEYDSRIETLGAVAEIVTNVHALKDQCKAGSGTLDYACTHWAYHLSLAEWDDDLRSIVTVFMRQKLQQWLVKAWCLQDLETCLRTLCEVRELCLAANPPIHFDPDAQHTAADTKAEEDAEKASLAVWGVKEVDKLEAEMKRLDELIAEMNVERKVAENDSHKSAAAEKAAETTYDASTSSRRPSRFKPLRLHWMDNQSRGVFPGGGGGCWTCRLRSQECDERREDNSCSTCKRLSIDCLGWEPPKWILDNKAVDDYNAGIRAQLTRFIRGQSNVSAAQASAVASSSTSASSSSVLTSQQFQGSASGSGSSRINDFGIPMRADSLGDTFVIPIFGLASKSPPYNINLPLKSSINPADPLTLRPSPMGEMHFNPEFNTATQDLYDLSVPSTQMEHVFYYFEHIRKLQYAFTGNSVANTTYSLVLQHPQGPVANAISALASLHFGLIRIAHGFEVPNPILEHSPAMRFYDSAHQQIYRNKQTTLRESDANAAILMLSFSLMSGGVTDWRPMLDIASEWLVRTGITANDNPNLMVINMNEASQLALKATMWCDIMSTLTLKTTPKHLSLYRRLFHGGSGYWGLTQQGIGDDSALRMDSLTGCPDEVLLGIAEIATLSYWKMQELRKGSLNMRELVRRGDVIERHLRTQTETVLPAEADQTQLHPELASMAVKYGNVQNSPTGYVGTSLPADDTRRIVADIFQEATILYLHTVLSDSIPGESKLIRMSEIVKSIVAMVQLLNRLPASNIDRCLVFPICLAGCLTDDPIIREFLKARLQPQRDGFGNIDQTLQVMETAWQRQDSQGGIVEWQNLLEMQRLLLV